VREKIRQILAVWQYRAKVSDESQFYVSRILSPFLIISYRYSLALQSIRNRRFATALSVLSNTSPSSFLTPDLMTIGPGLVVYSSMSGKFSLSHLSPHIN
jgi:hypothetical protein